MLLGFALGIAVIWFYQGRKGMSLIIAAAGILITACDAWLARGLREVFEEQERLLEEARKKKDA